MPSDSHSFDELKLPFIFLAHGAASTMSRSPMWKRTNLRFPPGSSPAPADPGHSNSYQRPKVLTHRLVLGRWYESWFGARPPHQPRARYQRPEMMEEPIISGRWYHPSATSRQLA
jgi:hypothetical protein